MCVMLKTQVMGGFVVSHLPEQRVLLWLVVVVGGEAFINRRLCGSWEWRNHYWFVVPLLEFSDLGFCDVS